MTKQTTPTSSYKEVRIGKTIYRVTSFFSGEKDLGKTLEQLAVRRAHVGSHSSCQRFQITESLAACRIIARRWILR